LNSETVTPTYRLTDSVYKYIVDNQPSVDYINISFVLKDTKYDRNLCKCYLYKYKYRR